MEKMNLSLLGPLKRLAGTWKGSSGDDTAPANNRGIAKSAFRELFVFSPFGPANNHEQTLYGLSYNRTAWRIGVDSPFHEQIGYFLWDAEASQVMHSFMIPRGMTVLAGGQVAADSSVIKLAATLGSPTFGICSNPFLDREFKTMRYESTLQFVDDSTFSYEENTQIQMKGSPSLFNHIDKNILTKVP